MAKMGDEEISLEENSRRHRLALRPNRLTHNKRNVLLDVASWDVAHVEAAA